MKKEEHKGQIEAKGKKAISDVDNMRSIFTQMDLAPAHWKSISDDEYSLEGYQKNVIAYRCIKEISDAIGGLKWNVVNKRTGRILDKHPLLDLLQRPNPGQSKTSFFTTLSSFKQISGNSYVQAVGPDNGSPRELYVLPPTKMTVVPGDNIQMPKRFEFRPNKDTSTVIKFDIDQVTGYSEVMHLKTFNPLNEWYGQSPLASAAFSIDLHNQSSEWNMKLLQNGARPSGALIAKDGLATEQRAIVKETFRESYSGARNAGKPLVMEGDITWIDMMLSPRDMDYLESRNVSSRDIATAFRVPPILLNMGSDTTYANMQEARLSMVENTIIPEANLLQDELNHWLVPMFGDNIEIQYDIDEIPSIINKRAEMYQKLQHANFLLTNEKRKLAGFEELTPEQLEELTTQNNPVSPMLDEPDEEEEEEAKAIETKTEVKMEHYHKFNPLVSGATSSSNDHNHQFIVGDTKTSVVQGHSHKIGE